MNDQLFHKPPKRMKQPTKDAIRAQLELAGAQASALEIYVERQHTRGAWRALQAIHGEAAPAIPSATFLHRLLGL